MLEYYPRLAELLELIPRSEIRLRVFKRYDTVKSEELTETFDLSKDTEKK